MDWQEFFKSLGLFGISAATIGAVVAYLIRKLMEQELKKDFEEFKIKLQTESEKAKTQYTILQEKRAQVIVEIYQKLYEVTGSMRSLINPFQLAGEKTEDEKRKIAAEKAQDFVEFFQKNKLYLNQESFELLSKINDTIYSAWIDFNRRDTHIATKAEEDLWFKAWSQISSDVDEVESLLIENLRKTIGSDK